MTDFKAEYIGELEEMSQDIDTLISRIEEIDSKKVESDDIQELSYRLVKLIEAYKDTCLLLDDIEMR